MKQDKDLRRLIDLLMSGDITPAEQRQLQTLLSVPDLAPEFAIYRDMIEWMDSPLPHPTTAELQAVAKASAYHRPVRRWAVAASIAAIFCLSAAAAGVWFTFSENSEVSESSEFSEISETTAPKPDFFVFDNVEMQQVAATLAKHFRLTPVFQNEAAKRVRVYLKINKQKTINEVVEQLNELEEFTASVSDGKLIIK